MKQFFLNLVSGAFADAGETKLEEVLQQLHEKDLDGYKAAIYGGLALVKALKPLTEKSANKIDDAFINAVSDALTDSAKANGLELA